MGLLRSKPRVCIALPGIHYHPHTTYVLNTLPLVEALRDEFDVTLVFRKHLEPPAPDLQTLTILDPFSFSEREHRNRDPYFAPSDMLRAWKYILVLDRFAQKHARDFDVVIERQWSLVGALASAFQRQGVPSSFILEAEFYQGKSTTSPLLGKALDNLLPWMRKRWIDQVDQLIVETEQTTRSLVRNGYLDNPKLVTPIPNGIDPAVFFPRDRQQCRETLGIDQHTFVLTYVGSLRRFIQEPGPLIEALGREKPRHVVLHMVGDGTHRQELEQLAQQVGAAVVFHGRCSQEVASLYVGAADLCLAPYNASRFPQGYFTSASLKVCEYLACGRLVVSIPCDRMNHLLDHGQYGYLVENEVDAYRAFLRNLPTREAIATQEQTLQQDLHNLTLKQKQIVLTWDDIAEMYKSVIDYALRGKGSVSTSKRVTPATQWGS